MADAIVATAQTEKENLLRLNYNNNVYVVPTGIIVDNIPTKTIGNLIKQYYFLHCSDRIKVPTY